MGTLGKIFVKSDNELLAILYLDELKSIPDITRITGISRSTVRLRLIQSGVKMRDPVSALRLHPEKLGTGDRSNINRTEEWNNKISIGKLKSADINAAGISLKPNGYYEITRGVNKGKGLHVVIIEEHVGHEVPKGYIVHHINGIKTDNAIENLELMSRSEHSRIHALSKNGTEKSIGFHNYNKSGEENASSKLKSSDILNIIIDNRVSRLIAVDYNVSKSTITSIKSGKSWSHITNIKNQLTCQ